MPVTPFSRPKPLRLKPPNGVEDDLVFIVERQNAQYRTEDFLLRDRRFIVDTADDRGQIERPLRETRIGGRGTTGQYPGTRLTCRIDNPGDMIAMRE